jgi:hypothetical protein
MSGFWRKSVAVLTLAVSLLSSASVAADEAFEQPPLELDAALIVPDELMVGEGYKIDALVVNDGYSNTYRLITDWGDVEAISDYRLRARIQEVQAMVVLDSMSRAGVFGDALKAGVLAPIEGAKALVTAPIETTTGAVKGLGRWFGNVARSITSDDPHQEGALSSAAGWASTKRAFAVELGVDPHTDWEPLQQGLVSVSRAAFAGGITVGVAMGMATEDTALELPVLLLSMTNDMNQVLIDNAPELLTEINQKKLLEMGIGEEIVDTFLRNYSYTPLEKLLLVEALNRMSGAAGREIFLAQAAAAPDKIVARYFQQRAEMIANYHTQVAETDVVEIADLPIQQTRDGRLIGVFPIDYLAWTADASVIAGVASEFIAQSAEIESGEFWFEGSVSQIARAGLEAQGWTVKERVGLLTGESLQALEGSEPGTVSPAVRGAVMVAPN